MSNTTTIMEMTTPVQNTTNTSAYVRPFDDTSIVVVATILIIFMVVCWLLNGVTIAVILKTPSLRKDKFMMLILSLCCSDLISASISWIWLHRRTWGFDDFNPIPPFFCKLYWGGDIMTNFVTAMHIFGFACLRFTAIKFPTTFRRLKRRTLKIGIMSVWLVCFGCAFIPHVIWFKAAKRDRTSDSPVARWPACTLDPIYLEEYRSFVRIGYPIMLHIPVIGVVLMSLLITGIVYYHLSSTQFNLSSKNRRKDKQAIIQLLLIACCFIVGYVPFTAYEIWAVQSWPSTQYYARMDYWFGTVGYICIRFSETMNPIFYNLGSPKMRASTFNLLKNTCNVDSMQLRSISNTSKSTRVHSAVKASASESVSVK